MPDVLVVASPKTYLASLGVVLDAHTVLAELYQANSSLSDYSRMNTRVSVLTADGGPVRLAGGRSLGSDGGLGSEREARLVYLPAFEVSHTEEADAGPSEEAALSDWLRRRHRRGAILAAAGASVWRLAHAGLLAGERVAVEPRFAPAFRRAFPSLELEPLQGMNTTGQAMTCAGPAFEREFVARVFAHAVSPGVAEWLALRWGGPPADGVAHSADPLVARAQLWIRERFTETFRIQDLAKALSISHQTLIRRFRQAVGKTPRDYAQALRIQAASMMLRETNRTVAEVAALVGYSDLPTFRTVFREHTGLTPRAFRASPLDSPWGVKTPAS